MRASHQPFRQVEQRHHHVIPIDPVASVMHGRHRRSIDLDRQRGHGMLRRAIRRWCCIDPVETEAGGHRNNTGSKPERPPFGRSRACSGSSCVARKVAKSTVCDSLSSRSRHPSSNIKSLLEVPKPEHVGRNRHLQFTETKTHQITLCPNSKTRFRRGRLDAGSRDDHILLRSDRVPCEELRRAKVATLREE